MPNQYNNIKQRLDILGINYLENELMKKHTTFGIGGPADLVILPANNCMIEKIIKIISENNIEFHFLGSGSNILVSDKGIKGVVISLKKSSKKIIFKDNNVFVECGAMLGTFVKKLSKKNIEGYETLIGVPGTVGGALVMNAGAFGSEISNNLILVNTININGEKHQYKLKDLSFSYRQSSFKNNEILLNAIFNCNVGNKNIIERNKRTASELRKKNQPLKYRSAGSIFKNPSNVAAGYLIDKAGLKGKQIGNAQISNKHANFILNLGNAKSTDVLELIKIIKREVKVKFNIKLDLEIKILGEIYEKN